MCLCPNSFAGFGLLGQFFLAFLFFLWGTYLFKRHRPCQSDPPVAVVITVETHDESEYGVKAGESGHEKWFRSTSVEAGSGKGIFDGVVTGVRSGSLDMEVDRHFTQSYRGDDKRRFGRGVEPNSENTVGGGSYDEILM